MTPKSFERRRSSSSNQTDLSKFPDFEQSLDSRDLFVAPREDHVAPDGSPLISSNSNPSKLNGILHSQGWQHRRSSHLAWESRHGSGHGDRPSSRHSRQKSLSDAIRTIRTRKGSVSANAQEIAKALKAPISIKLIV